MKTQGAPLSLKQLNISNKEIIDIGFKGEDIKKILNELFELTVVGNVKNDNAKLVEIARRAKIDVDNQKNRFKQF